MAIDHRIIASGSGSFDPFGAIRKARENKLLNLINQAKFQNLNKRNQLLDSKISGADFQDIAQQQKIDNQEHKLKSEILDLSGKIIGRRNPDQIRQDFPLIIDLMRKFKIPEKLGINFDGNDTEPTDEDISELSAIANAALGIQSEVLTPDETSNLGFPEGTVVQRDVSGKLNVLQKSINPKEQTTFLSQQEAKSLGFPEGTIAQRSPSGEINILQKGITPLDKIERQLKESTDKFDKASKIRGEVSKFTKQFRDIEDAYSRVKASQAGAVTAASDIALIFNFMKMLDPGSVVREGEFATAQNAAGVPDRVVNIYNKLLSGERLSAEQRENFVSEAGKQFNSAMKVNKKREDDFVSLGKRFGLDREDIIVRTDIPASPGATSAKKARLKELRRKQNL